MKNAEDKFVDFVSIVVVPAMMIAAVYGLYRLNVRR